MIMTFGQARRRYDFEIYLIEHGWRRSGLHVGSWCHKKSIFDFMLPEAVAHTLLSPYTNLDTETLLDRCINITYLADQIRYEIGELNEYI